MKRLPKKSDGVDDVKTNVDTWDGWYRLAGE